MRPPPKNAAALYCFCPRAPRTLDTPSQMRECRTVRVVAVVCRSVVLLGTVVVTLLLLLLLVLNTSNIQRRH